jgi:hypothetical protein
MSLPLPASATKQLAIVQAEITRAGIQDESSGEVSF